MNPEPCIQHYFETQGKNFNVKIQTSQFKTSRKDDSGYIT